jgi:hypothetical protein
MQVTAFGLGPPNHPTHQTVSPPVHQSTRRPVGQSANPPFPNFLSSARSLGSLHTCTSNNTLPSLVHLQARRARSHCQAFLPSHFRELLSYQTPPGRCVSLDATTCKASKGCTDSMPPFMQYVRRFGILQLMTCLILRCNGPVLSNYTRTK